MKFSKRRPNTVLFVLLVVFALIYIAVLWKIGYTMSTERGFWVRVESRLRKEGQRVPAKRGNILSDEDLLLAASVPLYRVYLDFVVSEKDPKRQKREQALRDSLFKANVDSFALGVSQLLPEVKPAELVAQLRQAHRLKRRHHLLLKTRLNYEQFQALRRLPYFTRERGKMGLHHEVFNTRTNPYGKLALRTIGSLYQGKDSAEKGLELGLDSLLRGIDGEQRVEKVRSSKLPTLTKAAIDGYDIRTTLNVKMQDVVEKMVGEQVVRIGAEYGICVLMEVATGDVKAITTQRRSHSDNTYYEGENRAVSQLMEPGSVFKPVSFLVALDEGKITPQTTVNVGGGIREMYGRKMRDANWASGGSGLMTLSQILAKSSNVGVSSLIDRAYAQQPQAFIDGVFKTGIADDHHLPIPGYTQPRIPSPKTANFYWSKTSLPWMSIGYVTQIPPISTVAFYNGIANNGRFMRPRFVTAKLKDGKVVEEYPPVVVREQMAKPEVVQQLQEMLVSVVTQGYGKKAGSRYFSVAGKTGTAQVWEQKGRTQKYLVSFAGYFPADKPLYSMIVSFVSSGGGASGGGMCGPVFKSIAESVMAQRRNTLYGQAKDTLRALLPPLSAGNLVHTNALLSSLRQPIVPPTDQRLRGTVWGQGTMTKDGWQLTPQTTAGQKMPDVVGYGLRDAVYRLGLLGLKVRCQGVGWVTAQSIPPHAAYRKGDTVLLYLGHAPKPPEGAAEEATATPLASPASPTKPIASPAVATKPTSSSAVAASQPASRPTPTTVAKPAQVRQKQPASAAKPSLATRPATTTSRPAAAPRPAASSSGVKKKVPASAKPTSSAPKPSVATVARSATAVKPTPPPAKRPAPASSKPAAPAAANKKKR